jgi:hypothetical protein
MIALRRTALLVGVLLSACKPSPSPESSPAVAEPRPEQPEVAPEEPVAPIEHPGAAGPQIETRTFRFTTLVTGATEAFERMIGSKGYYELELVGEDATVRKVGHEGKPAFDDDEIQVGVGKLAVADDSQWPAGERWSLEVELTGGEAKGRRLLFDLWILDDELHGTWAAPNPKEERVGDTWGLVQGRREVGDPLEVDNGGQSPCMACVRAFWNCEGQSFEQPACNSAESAWSKCEARLAKARSSAEVPRGCDDWSM